MKILPSILILGFGLGESAYAFSSDFHLGMDSYFSRDVVTPSTFPVVRASFAGSDENSKVDLELKMSPVHPKVFAIASKNLYYEIEDTDNAPKTEEPASVHFSFGRKWINWSDLDEDFGLGIYNPLDSWDRLRSTSQGLTGVFFRAESKSFHFNFFGSYLSLPEITPNVVIENHGFKLYHPQSVSAGPQTFNLLNRATPLGYNLLLPSLNKILFRPSGGFSFESKQNIEPLFVRFSWAYLPLNYFPMALQASLAIPIDQIVVDLRPRLLSHNLASIDFAYHFQKEIAGGFSMIRDEIITEGSIPIDYTTATLGTTYYWSPWVQYENFKLSQILSYGGLGADVGPYSSPTQNLFSSRILYRNATQLKMTMGEFTGKILHEFSINSNWFSLDWTHHMNDHWNVVVGGDILSAEKGAANQRGAEFLSDLRALDRIRVGVNYVF